MTTTFRRLRISTKLLLTILPLVVVAIGISAYLNNRNQEAEMLKQAQASAQTYGDIIRESLLNLMITQERVDDQYLARLSEVGDIHDLRVHFSVDRLRLREVFLSEERLKRLHNREQSVGELTDEEQNVLKTGEPLWLQKGTMFNAIIPFRATAKCQQCHAVPVGHVLGAANITVSLDRIAESIQSNWIRSIWIAYVFALIAIIISIILYRYLVAKRMKELVEATKIIGSGNLEHPLNVPSSKDELGELAVEFEHMRKRLKQAQEQAIHSERLSMIGQMASSIIHDFRTPMSTINLAVESLEVTKDISPERMQQWHHMIREAIGRMVSMAQELLDFSRGETRLEKVEFSLNEFVQLLVHNVKPNLEKTHVNLEVDTQYQGTATFDPDRMYRALVNIINNAQDAMPKGGTLTLALSRENGTIAFSIADTGVGIPPEIKEKMFDAFVTAGKKRGTGLGLAITKRIIDQHGGSILVESERGKGTTFTIKIPAQ